MDGVFLQSKLTKGSLGCRNFKRQEKGLTSELQCQILGAFYKIEEAGGAFVKEN